MTLIKEGFSENGRSRTNEVDSFLNLYTYLIQRVHFDTLNVSIYNLITVIGFKLHMYIPTSACKQLLYLIFKKIYITLDRPLNDFTLPDDF